MQVTSLLPHCVCACVCFETDYFVLTAVGFCTAIQKDPGSTLPLRAIWVRLYAYSQVSRDHQQSRRLHDTIPNGNHASVTQVGYVRFVVAKGILWF